MRVTANTYSNDLIDQLNSLVSRQSQLQTQVSTGQRVRALEDDPAVARSVLDLQSEARSVAQYQTNIAAQQNCANANYSAINSLKTISDRVGQIATLADGTKSPEQLAAYATEVTQLLQQAVQVVNTKQNGSYLLSGTLTDKPPFVMTTDANGNVTGVTYQGNQNVASTEIAAGLPFSAQVVGANTTGTGPRGLITDTASGADFFNHLIAFQKNLASGNVAAVASTDRPALAKDEDNLLFQVSQNGVVQARLTASASLMSDRATALDSQASQEAGADLAQTLVQLNATQNAYQATLQSGAKMFNLTLMDFLQ
jgi:flagellar hook-associated protein 3 FlgL